MCVVMKGRVRGGQIENTHTDGVPSCYDVEGQHIHTYSLSLSPSLFFQVNVPITFRGPNGPAAGVAAQHSQDFSSWYAHCPGLKVRDSGCM